MTLGAEMTALARETLTEPRRAAGRLAALDLPPQAPWLALGLVAVLWVLLDLVLGGGGSTATADWPGAELMKSPVTAVPLNAVSSILVTLSVQLCGRMFGQTPRFGATLILVLWLQFLLLFGMIASILVAAILPPVGALVGFAALGLYLWVLVQFAAVLNRIESLIGTALGLILAGLIVSFAFGLGLSLLIALGLVSIPGMA